MTATFQLNANMVVVVRHVNGPVIVVRRKNSEIESAGHCATPRRPKTDAQPANFEGYRYSNLERHHFTYIIRDGRSDSRHATTKSSLDAGCTLVV
jgi:hypothetical protein